MLTIITHEAFMNLKVQQFTCKCGKVHQWRTDTQQSPYSCLQCSKIMMDVSKIILEQKWRAAYHFGGEKAVVCNALV